jgi:hypothetical protein
LCGCVLPWLDPGDERKQQAPPPMHNQCLFGYKRQALRAAHDKQVVWWSFLDILCACRVLGTGVLMTSLTTLLRRTDVPGGPIPIGSFNALKKRLLQSVRLCACMGCVFCLVHAVCVGRRGWRKVLL